MSRYKYMRIPVWALSKEIMDKYNLHALVRNGYVLCEIRRGMYGLPHAGIIAYEQLVKILTPFSYSPTCHTPGLWQHKTRPISFSLCVDDFGIKYVGREHARHLLSALHNQYEATTDWNGSNYLGITLKWDYTNRTCDISMPRYIAAVIHLFQHPLPNRLEPSPHFRTEIQYGALIQFAPMDNTTPLLDSDRINPEQQIVGTFLHYGHAVDNTMLVALIPLATIQTKNTDETALALTKLLNYAPTHPNATLCYVASDMILHIYSNASYGSEPKSYSIVGGLFTLTSRAADPTKATISTPTPNGEIHTVSNIMGNMMSSTTKDEAGGIFHNAKYGIILRITLAKMGHLQLATPIQTDSSNATGTTNGNVKQRKSKAMDMQFYWVQDRVF